MASTQAIFSITKISSSSPSSTLATARQKPSPPRRNPARTSKTPRTYSTAYSTNFAPKQRQPASSSHGTRSIIAKQRGIKKTSLVRSRKKHAFDAQRISTCGVIAKPVQFPNGKRLPVCVAHHPSAAASAYLANKVPISMWTDEQKENIEAFSDNGWLDVEYVPIEEEEEEEVEMEVEDVEVDVLTAGVSGMYIDCGGMVELAEDMQEVML